MARAARCAKVDSGRACAHAHAAFPPKPLGIAYAAHASRPGCQAQRPAELSSATRQPRPGTQVQAGIATATCSVTGRCRVLHTRRARPQVVGLSMPSGRTCRTGRGMRVGVGWPGATAVTGPVPAHSSLHPRADSRHLLRRRLCEYDDRPVEALAAVPEECLRRRRRSWCAGITTFNSLRHTHARAGDLVAVLGIGGLGHLGRAARMGSRKARLAICHRLGRGQGAAGQRSGAAHLHRQHRAGRGRGSHSPACAERDPATATDAKSMSAAIGGLGTWPARARGASQRADRGAPFWMISGAADLAGWTFRPTPACGGHR